MILIKWKINKDKIKGYLIIKQDRDNLKKEILYSCGTRERRSQVFIRSLVVFGLVLIELRERLELTHFT
jgi:hypothetical protein